MSDERARLRALAEQAVTCTEGVGNMLMDRRYRYYLEATPDVVLRLLDDVERLTGEVEAWSEMAEVHGQDAQRERARAERLEAALRAIEEGCSFPADSVQRAVRDRARAALAEPAPGGQDDGRDRDAARWKLLTRVASLGFDDAPLWKAVIRLPVFDNGDQTITALVDRIAIAERAADKGA